MIYCWRGGQRSKAFSIILSEVGWRTYQLDGGYKQYRNKVVKFSTVTADELIELVAADLGSYKKPGSLTLTTEPLPKSPVGKIKRKDLREPFWAGRDRRVSGS